MQALFHITICFLFDTLVGARGKEGLMRRISIAAAALVLAGCVTTGTAMVDDRTMVISGQGSAYNTSAGVLNKIIHEAALKAQAAGYDYLRILSSQDDSRQGVAIMPGHSTTNTYGTASCFSYSCTGNATSNTYSTPAMAIPYVAPGEDVVVRFYRADEIPADRSGYLKVSSILAQK